MTASEVKGRLHDVRFPGESDEYRRARDELLEAEIDVRSSSRSMRERAARALPEARRCLREQHVRVGAVGHSATAQRASATRRSPAASHASQIRSSAR
jgi:hypothetical protein